MTILTFAIMLIAYYAIHSLLAANSVKVLVSRRMAGKHYRLIYNAIALILLLPLLWNYQSMNKTMILPNSLWNQIPGLAIVILGLWLTRKAMQQYDFSVFLGLDRYSQAERPGPEPLNTKGLNAMVRHPLYLASLLTFWGFFLLFPNDALLVLAVITSAYLVLGIRLEERKLNALYGEQYRDYQKRVPMIFPRLDFRKLKD